MCTVSATCNILSLHLFKFRLSNKWNNSLCSSGPGGSQAICPGWSDVWWMPGCPLWRKVCSFLLCQCYLFAVLLWILLGKHTFTCWQGISQASCEGGRRSPTSRPIPLELKRLKVYEHVQERRALPQGWEASGNWCILPRIKNVCFLFYFEVTLLNLSKIVWYIKKNSEYLYWICTLALKHLLGTFFVLYWTLHCDLGVVADMTSATARLALT